MNFTEICNHHKLEALLMLDYDHCIDLTEDSLRSWIDHYHRDGDLYVVELNGFGYHGLDVYYAKAGVDPDFNPDPFNMFIFEDTDPVYAEKLTAHAHAQEEAWRMYKADRYITFGSLREAVEYAVTRMAELEHPADRRSLYSQYVSVRSGNESGHLISEVRFVRQ